MRKNTFPEYTLMQNAQIRSEHILYIPNIWQNSSIRGHFPVQASFSGLKVLLKIKAVKIYKVFSFFLKLKIYLQAERKYKS